MRYGSAVGETEHALFELVALTKSYRMGKMEVQATRGVDLRPLAGRLSVTGGDVEVDLAEMLSKGFFTRRSVAASASRNRYGAQRARAELFGSIGAGILGAGLALLFGQPLAAFTVPFLAVGGIVHALAMYQRHRLDALTGTMVPQWTQWTYLLCWILLLGLLAYVWWRVPG